MLRATILLLLVGVVVGGGASLRVCFREAEGSSQCQGERSSCSGWSSNPTKTLPFRDDTDDRPGGCTYQWKLEKSGEDGGREYRVCFQETEGSSQCQGERSSCSEWIGVGSGYSKPFRDDTDSRGGGCTYQWWVEEREAGNVPPTECRFLFKENEGSSQCQQHRIAESGWSTSPQWTAPYRDDTDDRPGGCTMQFGLECRLSGPSPSLWNLPLLKGQAQEALQAWEQELDRVRRHSPHHHRILAKYEKILFHLHSYLNSMEDL